MPSSYTYDLEKKGGSIVFDTENFIRYSQEHSKALNAFANGKNYSFVRYSMIDIYDRHLIDSLRVISEKKQQTLKKTNYDDI